MESTFTSIKICNMGLSKACFLFGILDLVLSAIMIIVCALNFYKYHVVDDIVLLITVAIGIFTCLLMIAGSKWEKRWLIFPHLAWAILRVGLIGMLTAGVAISSQAVIASIISVVLFSLGLVCSFVYWNIMFNRFVEIKYNHSILPVLVEMD
ncbi:uncharacterized protein [Chelonus insularis]|uniref:uncharacterized protein n=1 Tax=Chelonus insularis TaxID=460826 RepID=UPI0015898287|nr:uncharacterized protein LOC118063646 [Chelonus insularis]